MNTHPPDFDEGIPNDLNHLLISFRFVNYSDSPAVITDLRAAAFLGPGPNTGYGQLGPDLSEAEKFFVRLKDPRKWGRNRLERPDFHIYEVRTIEYQDENGKLTHQLISIPFSFQPGIVMVGNISTGKFACLCEVFTGTASADEIEKLFRAMRWNAIRPWLIGSVRYEDMYRRPYQTNFCVSVEFHRGPAHEEGGPPYNSSLTGHTGVAHYVRDDMRLATVLAAAAVLGLGISAAHANDRVGTVQSVNMDGRTFTLDDGNVYKLQTNAPKSAMEILKQMKAGQKVRVTYEANAAAYYVSDIQPEK